MYIYIVKNVYVNPSEVEWEIDQNDRKAYISLANTINNDQIR